MAHERSINYRHLFYFWTVARLGSVASATKELHLSQPAISAQIRLLERSLGEKLLQRSGRGLVVTDVGRLVQRYAEEIFGLGRELQQALAGSPSGRLGRLAVGITDALPKLVAYRILGPALSLPVPMRLVLRDDRPDRLFADLATHALDLVLSDSPVPPTTLVRAYSHLLGECGVTVFGVPSLAKTYRKRFPTSLAGAPLLLPTDSTAVRAALERWFEAKGVRPAVVAEIEDSAVLKVFGAKGAGLFTAPTVVEDDVREQYRVAVVGRIPEVRERFYATSVERRISHPGVRAITEGARRDLFG
ncbi:MAG: LysR family transcriptional regulator [Longimicrobiales bacterium]